MDLVRTSKFLSLVLRHDPGKIGIRLDENGWVDVADLLAAMRAHGRGISEQHLLEVVEKNDKKRFALSGDGKRIRASQGHSVAVELALPPTTPPPMLYHGTATRFLESIRREGLDKRQRTHVHLSADHATAVSVGQRHGKVVVLEVKALEMVGAGYSFYLSDNGVWLVSDVPPQYLVFPAS